MILKCKMCGGDLDIQEKSSVGTCLFCGTKQTLPRLVDDKRANLYERANHFRRQNEFEKAAAIYESILNEDTSDAEAHWSLVLCKYGVVYVEDPATEKRIPTCNRTLFASVLADGDYQQALAHADEAQRGLYEAEAKTIDAIQKGILEISEKEEPFDIFICYKETDDNGDRTPDSVLAQDMYYQLSEEGFKVFFSRITLEGILGAAYEPYIFAALHSAPVMVVVGTKPEYFNAVWVKNEWSRFLAMKKGGAKKTLIPAYKDMDPYHLPADFADRQALDMGKLGFMQELVRGIKKVLAPVDAKPAAESRPLTANETTYLKRIAMFLADNDVESADKYCALVLDSNPDNTLAYFYKTIIDFKKNVGESRYGRRLESLLPEMAAEEKAFITEANKVDCTLAFIKAGAVKRLKYTLGQFPDVLGYNVPDELNPVHPLLNYAMYASADVMGTVGVLLEAGANPNSYRKFKGKAGPHLYSALGEAIWNKKSPELAKLLLVHGANPNGEDDYTHDDGTRSTSSMLSVAVNNGGSLQLVQALMDHGADVNSVRTYHNQHGNTVYSAFFDSIRNNQYELTELFLKHGANPNMVVDIVADDGTRCTKSALTCAILDAKNSKMIELLCRSGAHWNARIKWKGVKKQEMKFPYHKHLSMSKDFITFLRQKGWRGNSKIPALIRAGVFAAVLLIVAAYLFNFQGFQNLFGGSDAKAAAEAGAAVKKSTTGAKTTKPKTISYADAAKMWKPGSYEEALPALNAAGGLKFGKYSWRILLIKDGKALLITDKVIGKRPFNSNETEKATWEGSALRQYLNGEFLNGFGPEERAKIAPTKLRNARVASSGGKDTTDKVFLLSADEARKYFKNVVRSDSGVPEFKNEKEKNAWWKSRADRAALDSEGLIASWWLRTPASISRDYGTQEMYVIGLAADVDTSGISGTVEKGIRPALWLTLD